jgi:phosphotransferase system HPr (HPr) family protein
MYDEAWITSSNTTCTKQFVVSVLSGLHLRPAAALAKTAMRFDSDITVLRKGLSSSARSIVGIMQLEAQLGQAVRVTAQGPDAPEAMAAIATLFINQFAS